MLFRSWALGGGTELLLALDIRLVAEEAKLGQIVRGKFIAREDFELAIVGRAVAFMA